MSRFNVCNLITLFWQLAKLEEVSPKHSSNCAVFQRHCDVLTTDSQINHHHHHNHHHHIGQIYYVLRWKKKGAENLPSLNILGSWSYNLNVFPFQVLAWMNCHYYPTKTLIPWGSFVIDNWWLWWWNWTSRCDVQVTPPLVALCHGRKECRVSFSTSTI